jgi:hypothetical protein
MLSHRADLDRLAAALIKYETLSAADIKAVLQGKPINPKPPRRKDAKVKPPAELSRAEAERSPPAPAKASGVTSDKPIQWLREEARAS